MIKLLKISIILSAAVLSGCGVYNSDLKTAQAYCMEKTGSYLLGTVYDSGPFSIGRFSCYRGEKGGLSYTTARAYLINKELDKENVGG